jgi:hypothetical protein
VGCTIALARFTAGLNSVQDIREKLTAGGGKQSSKQRAKRRTQIAAANQSWLGPRNRENSAKEQSCFQNELD